MYKHLCKSSFVSFVFRSLIMISSHYARLFIEGTAMGHQRPQVGKHCCHWGIPPIPQEENTPKIKIICETRFVRLKVSELKKRRKRLTSSFILIKVLTRKKKAR